MKAAQSIRMGVTVEKAATTVAKATVAVGESDNSSRGNNGNGGDDRRAKGASGGAKGGSGNGDAGGEVPLT